MPSIGVQVKAPDGQKIGRAVLGEDGRIVVFLYEEYYKSIRDLLLIGASDDICVHPNLLGVQQHESSSKPGPR